jgi:hypothetical protein
LSGIQAGNDSARHFLLILTNTGPTSATLEKIEVLHGSNSSKVLGSYGGQELLSCLRTSGNTSAPHLHFHLMEGTSVLGSNGIPYQIDSVAIAGRVSAADSAAASGVEGDWSMGLSPNPDPRHNQFPLDLDIVDFSSGK